MTVLKLNWYKTQGWSRRCCKALMEMALRDVAPRKDLLISWFLDLAMIRLEQAQFKNNRSRKLDNEGEIDNNGENWAYRISINFIKQCSIRLGIFLSPLDITVLIFLVHSDLRILYPNSSNQFCTSRNAIHWSVWDNDLSTMSNQSLFKYGKPTKKTRLMLRPGTFRDNVIL